MKCHRNEMDKIFEIYVELALKMQNSNTVLETVLYYLYMRVTLNLMFQMRMIDNMQFSLISNEIDALFESIIEPYRPEREDI